MISKKAERFRALILMVYYQIYACLANGVIIYLNKRQFNNTKSYYDVIL